MTNITILRINLLLKHIDEILDDTKGITLKELKESNLLLRATCFSLAQIGEQMNKLNELIGEQYPNIPWKEARKMRNIIVHDYGSTDVEEVYATITNDLENLRNSFIVVRYDLQNNEELMK